MAKRLQEYVKYTTKELDSYTETEGSCVSKINTNLHLSMGPFCLADFKHVLMAHLMRSKVGFYDINLDGIVLDVKNIKLLGTTGALRADDPRIHVDVNADVYVFKPEEGSVMTGIVKHIGPHQVGVILYRVFNANLRVAHKIDKEEVQMEKEVKFRIRKYNLQNVFPYIDGELLTPKSEKALAQAKKKIIKQEDTTDSGIEEKEGCHELDDLLSLIKTETLLENDEVVPVKFQKISKKCKKTEESFEDSAVTDSSPVEKKTKIAKKRKSVQNTTTPEQSKITDSIETPLRDNIKRELYSSSNDKSSPLATKTIKTEKESDFFGNVHITEEIEAH